ncbi:hypothetical protein HYU93_01345 [Candidatus Daviesbacteria bacterium]|nr:hypothetical protein [Candidatus Daviesbacteria bacterium]
MKSPERKIEEPTSLIGRRETLVTRLTKEYKHCRAIVIAAGGFALSLSLVACSGESDSTTPTIYANGGHPETATVTPAATATATETVTPTPTHTPTPTFTPSSTPDIDGTVRARLTASATVPSTPDIPSTVRAILTPGPAASPPTSAPVPPGVVIVPIPQVNPGPDRDVIVVKPEVVKPEVVKPEIVKVPEIVTVQVPVEATPNPDIISLHKKDFYDDVERRAQKIAEDKTLEIKQKAEAEAKAQIEAAKKAEEEAKRAKIAAETRPWSFDWTSGLIAGAVGLGLGAAEVWRGLKTNKWFIIK